MYTSDDVCQELDDNGDGLVLVAAAAAAARYFNRKSCQFWRSPAEWPVAANSCYYKGYQPALSETKTYLVRLTTRWLLFGCTAKLAVFHLAGVKFVITAPTKFNYFSGISKLLQIVDAVVGVVSAFNNSNLRFGKVIQYPDESNNKTTHYSPGRRSVNRSFVGSFC